MSNIVSYVPLAILVILVGTFIYRLVRFHGFSGALFGASVSVTAGEAMASDSIGILVRVRVHTLDTVVPFKAVGVELVAKMLGYYRNMPITLSRKEARHLAELLLQAAEGPVGH